MGQHDSQLAHYILELAPELVLSSLLVIGTPSHSSVPAHGTCSIVLSWSQEDGLWQDKL